jgi:hypothetical protein
MTIQSQQPGAMTLDERVRALEPLGFSPRQTRFLVTVALHGGFCLRRQYAAFARIAYGKNVIDFFEALVSRNLARAYTQRGDRGSVYHLNWRPLYRAIGQDDNRNRRVVSAAVIARKLMVLDYVLAHPEADWLGTEQDKVDVFTRRLGVALSDLPQKAFVSSRPDVPPTVRFFIHKLPVAVLGNPPTAAFVYLATAASANDFSTFLVDHRRLLSRLSSWTIVLVTQLEARALEAFSHLFARFSPTDVAAARAVSGDLLWYFERREAVDADALASLSVADLDRYRVLRERFKAPVFEAQYCAWRAGADANVGAGGDVPSGHVPASLPPASVSQSLSRGRLVIERLPFDYSRFGSLPGIA